MFAPDERDVLRDLLVEHASADDRISACALVGSAARGEEDAWSDIDVALRLAEGVVLDEVVAEWTTWLRTVVEVADHLDVRAAGALYRVFLLANSFQVDLSFWPHEEFRATGGPMLLLFGGAAPPEAPRAQDAQHVARMGWLHALHARAAIARERAWQAEMMLAGLRDQVIGLACLRLGLDAAQGRGAHLLPADLTAGLAAARASSLAPDEQRRSLRDTLAVYRTEVALHDPHLACAVGPPLDEFGRE